MTRAALLPGLLRQGVALTRRHGVDNGSPAPELAFGPSRAAACRDEQAVTRERSARVEALPRPGAIGGDLLLPKVG